MRLPICAEDATRQQRAQNTMPLWMPLLVARCSPTQLTLLLEWFLVILFLAHLTFTVILFQIILLQFILLTYSLLFRNVFEFQIHMCVCLGDSGDLGRPFADVFECIIFLVSENIFLFQTFYDYICDHLKSFKIILHDHINISKYIKYDDKSLKIKQPIPVLPGKSSG